MNEFPAISVVAIGRNEGPRLVRCLQSIRDSNYPSDRLEVIYVDTNSTDDSCDAAEKLGAKVVRIKPERPSAATARNAGCRAARHDLIHFFDGDTVVNPSWFKKAAKAMSDPAVACVFGRREEVAARATIYNFWAHHGWHVSPGPAEHCAGDALFRRDVLEKAGGFDEKLIAGEEPDLCYRIRSEQKLTILAIDEPMTLHDMGMTRFRQFWRRSVRTGHAFAEVGGRHRGMVRWRKARWRNLFYAIATPVSLVLSLSFSSVWPLAIWLFWVATAWVRNAVRARARVGSFADALRYSASHYITKTPEAVGQIIYWFRAAFRREPQRLIEYRTPQAGPPKGSA
jgi:cellulose synthase/poly-beta-1,6-N-acetylglucosamine synthase-like glycosyltransferase